MRRAAELHELGRAVLHVPSEDRRTVLLPRAVGLCGPGSVRPRQRLPGGLGLRNELLPRWLVLPPALRHASWRRSSGGGQGSDLGRLGRGSYRGPAEGPPRSKRGSFGSPARFPRRLGRPRAASVQPSSCSGHAPVGRRRATGCFLGSVPESLRTSGNADTAFAGWSSRPRPDWLWPSNKGEVGV